MNVFLIIFIVIVLMAAIGVTVYFGVIRSNSVVPSTEEVKTPTIAPTPTIPPEQTYTFVQGKDSSGNDIGQQQSLADNVPGLKAWCTASTACKGFNTNGWMKGALAPQAQWGTWTTDPNKGFYYKN